VEDLGEFTSIEEVPKSLLFLFSLSLKIGALLTGSKQRAPKIQELAERSFFNGGVIIMKITTIFSQLFSDSSSPVPLCDLFPASTFGKFGAANGERTVARDEGEGIII
jgi:hypothetical protein